MENKERKFDFAGWATRSGIKCADGRTIMENAFAHQDGSSVPLVWNHDHNSPDRVLGHAILRNIKGGVRAYCYLNTTDNGKNARAMIENGDLSSFSIFAHNLKQDNDRNVIKGDIVEVSLVLKGANPGAKIDEVIAHDGTNDSSQANISFNFEDNFSHIQEDDAFEHSSIQSDPNPSNGDNLAGSAGSEGGTDNTIVEHSDDKGDNKTSVEKAFESMSEEQKMAADTVIGFVLSEKKNELKEKDEELKKKDDRIKELEDENKALKEATASHSDIIKGENNMSLKHNIFLNDDGSINKEKAITVAELNQEIANARTSGVSLKSHLAHQGIIDKNGKYLKTIVDDNGEQATLAHSITGIDNLYPDAKAVGAPATLDMKNTWVAKVLGAVKHAPFANIKSAYFDLTDDDARALGYKKGDQKDEETIVALKRVTTPQTVYKYQTLDRDDEIDITDIDIVAYLRQEMLTKLRQEVARAVLIGDGRQASDKHKINPLNIRPILGDNAAYVTTRVLEKKATETDVDMAVKFIDDSIVARKEYKGSGALTLYVSEDMLASMLLIKDTNKHFMYTEATLKNVLRVADIVTIPPMEGLTVQVGDATHHVMGIFANLSDYTMGSNRKGQTTHFTDFDIEYNKNQYLVETRVSGALTQPKSAIVVQYKDAATEETE